MELASEPSLGQCGRDYGECGGDDGCGQARLCGPVAEVPVADADLAVAFVVGLAAVVLDDPGREASAGDEALLPT